MDFTFAVLLFALGLLAVIMLHELGHYAFARLFGFKVEEYFVGFGPRLWSTTRKGIEYGVKAFPLGGYVKITGMDPSVTVAPEDVPRAYGSKPIWQRAIVIAAGPGVHFVLAALIFATCFALYGNVRAAPTIGTVQPQLAGEVSPAAAAGIQPGDVVIAVGGVQDPSSIEIQDEVTRAAEEGATVPVTVRRGSESVQLEVTPVMVTERIDGTDVTYGRMGVTLTPSKPGAVGALAEGFREVGTTIRVSVGQIGRIFGPQGVGRLVRLTVTDEPRQVTDPTSVVGVSQQLGHTGADGDWATFLYAMGFLTVFIGLINLIPLPPFDGGHLLTLGIEKVRGRAVDLRKLVPISAAVLIFFVLFVGLTMFLDVTKPIPFR
jgi:membrane-associated protease RseP (regulator of RpoE activity)